MCIRDSRNLTFLHGLPFCTAYHYSQSKWEKFIGERILLISHTAVSCRRYRVYGDRYREIWYTMFTRRDGESGRQEKSIGKLPSYVTVHSPRYLHAKQKKIIVFLMYTHARAYTYMIEIFNNNFFFGWQPRLIDATVSPTLWRCTFSGLSLTLMMPRRRMR